MWKNAPEAKMLAAETCWLCLVFGRLQSQDRIQYTGRLLEVGMAVCDSLAPPKLNRCSIRQEPRVCVRAVYDVALSLYLHELRDSSTASLSPDRQLHLSYPLCFHIPD